MFLRRTHSWRAIGARSKSRPRGATLIELLVVMTLIGLLIGMLLPSVSRSMQVASKTLCKHHLRELGHALILYRMDNDGWLPVVARAQDGIQAIRDSEPWFAKLFPIYLSEPSLMTCPEDPYRWRMLELQGDLTEPRVGDFSSYGINKFIMTTSTGNGMLADLDRLRPDRPLDTILVADLGPDDPDGAARAAGVIGPARNASLLDWDDGFDPFDAQAPSTPWMTTRHGVGVNVLTLAGGVRTARTAHLMQQSVSSFYSDCAAGGCTFCTRLGLAHYSFARDHLYWWTGRAPSD